MICKLALEDGSVFTGVAVGATGTRTGEVVFNTAMTGYQEVFTDPSYCGQIVTMTFPLQGNYGVNDDDYESHGTHLSGVVLRELPRRPSNFRASGSLPEFLEKHNIIGIAGVDTRAITRRIRFTGALRGVISTEISNDLELVRVARAATPMTGANLVSQVAPHDVTTWSGDGQPSPATPRKQSAACHIVALDCGIKHNILRLLAGDGARVTVAPADIPASAIMELAPDGLLIGNGPGDPAAVTDTVNTLRELLGKLPMFGICLGHQLLALALGAQTYKLKFGHHGANLPVLNQPTGRIEITSQNHGFAVDTASLERVGGTVTHINLNDDSLEGFLHRDQRIMAVQFHPEANPGPHDAAHLFRRFTSAAAEGRRIDAALLAQWDGQNDYAPAKLETEGEVRSLKSEVTSQK
jgi:carbamoyl-phosphate synthase small subunit